MKIERLVLKNFRGIRAMDLELNERLTVLVGVNGSGKSSILQALALPLSDVCRGAPYWLRDPISKAMEPTGVNNSDVLNGESSGSISVYLKSDVGTDRPDFDLEIARDERHGVNGTAATGLTKSASVEQMEQSLRRDPKSLGSLLAMRYIPERYISPKFDDVVDGNAVAPRSAYSSALSCGRGFWRMFHWMSERQNAEAQELEVPWKDALEMLKEGTRPPGADPHLHAARKTIADFMGGTGLHYSQKDGTFLIHKDGQTMSVNQLSDGEKGLLALVGDLTHRLSLTHPHLTDTETLLRKAEAVVMIDEMEMHLHPSWQRMVVPRLVETFPNVQFIITTHSPQVLSHVEDKSVFLLRQTDEGIVHTRLAEAYGQSYERLLEDVFGVAARPDEIQQEMDELFDLIQRNGIQQARQKLDELRRRIGTDPDLVRAGFLLHRKEEAAK